MDFNNNWSSQPLPSSGLSITSGPLERRRTLQNRHKLEIKKKSVRPSKSPLDSKIRKPEAPKLATQNSSARDSSRSASKSREFTSTSSGYKTPNFLSSSRSKSRSKSTDSRGSLGLTPHSVETKSKPDKQVARLAKQIKNLPSKLPADDSNQSKKYKFHKTPTSVDSKKSEAGVSKRVRDYERRKSRQIVITPASSSISSHAAHKISSHTSGRSNNIKSTHQERSQEQNKSRIPSPVKFVRHKTPEAGADRSKSRDPVRKVPERERSKTPSGARSGSKALSRTSSKSKSNANSSNKIRAEHRIRAERRNSVKRDSVARDSCSREPISKGYSSRREKQVSRSETRSKTDTRAQKTSMARHDSSRGRPDRRSSSGAGAQRLSHRATSETRATSNKTPSSVNSKVVTQTRAHSVQPVVRHSAKAYHNEPSATKIDINYIHKMKKSGKNPTYTESSTNYKQIAESSRSSTRVSSSSSGNRAVRPMVKATVAGAGHTKSSKTPTSAISHARREKSPGNFKIPEIKRKLVQKSGSSRRPGYVQKLASDFSRRSGSHQNNANHSVKHKIDNFEKSQQVKLRIRKSLPASFSMGKVNERKSFGSQISRESIQGQSDTGSYRESVSSLVGKIGKF